MQGARGKNLYIETFGCQMNEYDTWRMVRLMSGQGYAHTQQEEEADLIVLNTCSIREKAQQKVMSRLGRLARLKERKPSLIIALAGCLAQQEGEGLLKAAPQLDLVIGTHAIHRLPELVRAHAANGRRSHCTEFDYIFGPSPALAGQAAPVTAFVTIMQGCDNFCAYCVVPYVRGRETSRAPGEIEAEAQDLAAHGAREITLLGQNVNSYGRGLEEPVTFAGLLGRLHKIEGLKRLRFTTSHPKDLGPELMEAFARLPKLCAHLHLPVQSGSTRVLEAMNRRYTRRDYLDKIQALRAARPDIALTTDIIVGFPGETEEDFEETMDLIDEVRYHNIFSFCYSDRPMTKASRMPGKVDPQTASRRLARLQARQREITAQIDQALAGQVVEVLVEGPAKRGGNQLTGRTPWLKAVNFEGGKGLVGALARVEVTRVLPNSLFGRLLP